MALSVAGGSNINVIQCGILKVSMIKIVEYLLNAKLPLGLLIQLEVLEGK